MTVDTSVYLEDLVPPNVHEDDEVEYRGSVFHFSYDLHGIAAWYAAKDLAEHWVSTGDPLHSVRSYVIGDVDKVIRYLYEWQCWLLSGPLAAGEITRREHDYREANLIEPAAV